ncbi:hypothetical protein G9A89_016198 [Geosiphon pyriformis]|nr:hypothetical protein G9A89_016198 [Geosiphon pyriformis]
MTCKCSAEYDLSLDSLTTNAFCFRDGFMLLVLNGSIYFKCTSLLWWYKIAFRTFKKWKKLDLYSSVPNWFELFVHFLNGIASLPVCFSLSRDIGLLSVLGSYEVGVVHNHLLNVDASHLSVYTDKSLYNLNTVNMRAGAAVFFEYINFGLDVEVFGLVISLALKFIFSSSSIQLFLDSQTALNACKLELGLMCSNFRNRYVSGNKYANAFTKTIMVNSLHHFNSHLAISFTSRYTPGVCIYFMKALYYWLSVAVCKCLYNKCYLSVVCLFCGNVDFSSAFEKEYINTHNNQELKNNLYCNIKKKAFNITEKTKVVTKTPNLTVFEFCHAIYTQNQNDLGLPEGCCPAESALTYYINARINYYIGKEEEPHNTKLGLYRELSQYTTKEVAVIAITIVKIHQEIEQYANKNFLISTGNTREHANKTKKNLKTNQESNQQKLRTPAQTPKKTVTQSIKKQRIYSPKDKSYHFSPENKIQISLGAVSSSTSTPQMPRTPSYTDKIKQRNWRNIPITGGYSLLFQNPLFQPKFRTGFENREEEFKSESEKETSEKTITRPVTGTNSQSRNQETCDQEEELDIRKATFRNAQRNIIPLPLRPISPPAENGNEITTPYIVRLTDFSGEEEETDMHTWLREAQKAIQANNWNDQRAIQTLPFFLKGTADS